MIQIKIKDMAICLDFTFFMVMALLFMIQSGGIWLYGILSCTAHEISHIMVMALYKIPIERITFYGAGIKISSEAVENAAAHIKAMVYSAGCLMNFILAAIFWLSGIIPAAAANICIGIFNLIPIGEFDGARLLKLWAIYHCKAENIDKITRRASIISAIICAALLIILKGKVNFTLFSTLIYITVLAFIAV